MAIIRKKDLEYMSKDKLEDKARELKMELMKIRTQISRKQAPDKPGMIKEIKRTIARIRTIQRIRGDL